ncbi:MAG: hypothetical protein UV63_C0054G0009 [Microgenomates group bacterium GW2011_GWC1_43_11]|uniref:Uncharacterized protein n=1 Tax=Candidatus Gottesmanbacteria bacterium GW2011_GWB1_44_11c TaxID=1618447 RepID=A0A0G1GNN2_9BACT|nr:MAG: hypothetical protein UV63_C0054G0009 [Microgenomates group bacterium GW2011_GWC1_43_11]KKT36115.1 MAG: hypothetical protein UW22_C0044G0010 [Candidatus Gottesmanbacteria bacterium GW2011_GWB1_44_11c]HBA51411.1 hypothetical protein [Candidatus Uhrbacteria bacterium]HCM82052.1 hypothetical protein [Patescibacteria group bacterium]
MTDQTPQQPQINVEEFSKKSLEFYDQIKAQLEAESPNKYVAIDYETSRHWIGETASEALTKAKTDFPQKIFYLIQIGSPTTFSIQSIRTNDLFGKKNSYDFNWAH